MIKIKRALVSVSDKTGIVDFVRELRGFGVEVISTGGTAKLLKENNLEVIEISDYTGFPEMLDGRVKTLHPKIHAGLLALRDKQEHMAVLNEHNIKLIDMVVVNLYPFEETVKKPGVSLEEAIENIDIGGPAMLRSAAKNNKSVCVISSFAQYAQVIEEMKDNRGEVSEKTCFRLSSEVFKRTSGYDYLISEYLMKNAGAESGLNKVCGDELTLKFKKIQDLRYGENPHQKAAFYSESGGPLGLAGIKQLWGKELSFNNILDLNAAVNLVREFSLPAVVFIKHNNPCGASENQNLLKAYKDAWSCDKLSAFGGIVGINRKVELALAKAIAKSGFLECIISPCFSGEALDLLKSRKNLRLLEFPRMMDKKDGLDFKRVCGGLLLQDDDNVLLVDNNLKVVTKNKPTKNQMESLIFAWKVAKHVKSNAIIFARGTKTVGIGAGQMSRVDSVFIASKKAGKLASGAVLASDAFFPKEDAVILAAKLKIKAIIQPGGSIADEAIIKTADKHKIPMVFTGIRHFKH